nr:hypothetical protein [Tanacetum cinerariifolium]
MSLEQPRLEPNIPLRANLGVLQSCIKQFWTTVVVTQVNDVTRLQALLDKKKVVITEATIRYTLHLDDAEGVVVCSMNKFLWSWLELDTRSHPQSSHFTKPYSRASVENSIFLSIFLIAWCSFNPYHQIYFTCSDPEGIYKYEESRKGFSRVETPLFEGMLVEQHGDAEGDADEHIEEVNTGDAAEGDDSAAHGEVPTIAEEQSIPSPTPPSSSLQPPQDIPSTS